MCSDACKRDCNQRHSLQSVTPLFANKRLYARLKRIKMPMCIVISSEKAFDNFLLILNEIFNLGACPDAYKRGCNQRLLHVTVIQVTDKCPAGYRASR